MWHMQSVRPAGRLQAQMNGSPHTCSAELSCRQDLSSLPSHHQLLCFISFQIISRQDRAAPWLHDYLAVMPMTVIEIFRHLFEEDKPCWIAEMQLFGHVGYKLTIQAKMSKDGQTAAPTQLPLEALAAGTSLIRRNGLGSRCHLLTHLNHSHDKCMTTRSLRFSVL